MKNIIRYVGIIKRILSWNSRGKRVFNGDSVCVCMCGDRSIDPIQYYSFNEQRFEESSSTPHDACPSESLASQSIYSYSFTLKSNNWFLSFSIESDILGSIEKYLQKKQTLLSRNICILLINRIADVNQREHVWSWFSTAPCLRA